MGTFIARFAPVADTLEALEGELWRLGCVGVWERTGDAIVAFERADSPGEVEVYFPDDRFRSGFADRLDEIARRYGSDLLGLELVLERDWMQRHRELARPVRVGALVVDPREPEDSGAGAVPEEGLHIRVPARRAFGTGSHESTRLVLSLMQELDLEGRRILDVGCGTGVLSFAALHLGAAMVVGFDLDPLAAVTASLNSRLNDFGPEAPRFFAGGSDALRCAGSGPAGERAFDLLLVNVLPERIEGDEERLARCLSAGGTVLLSGLLGGSSPARDPSATLEALGRWKNAGCGENRRIVEGEWVGVELQGRGAP